MRVGRSAIRVGEFHIGVETNRPELRATLEAVFASSVVADGDVPANYSLAFRDPELATAPQAYHVSRGCERLASTPSLARALAVLRGHLAAHLPTDGAGLLRLERIAVMTSHGAMLAPGRLRRDLAWFERRTADRTVRVLESPWVCVDASRREVVVPPWPIRVGDDRLDATVTAAAIEAAATPGGRFPILAWVATQTTDGEPLTRAGALAQALAAVSPADRGSPGASLARLAEVIRGVELVVVADARETRAVLGRLLAEPTDEAAST